MVHQLAEAHAELTYLGGHQDVGSRGCLHTALEGAIVHGSHLVGMVGEIGVGTGIVERELAANEQRALVVTGREGSAESGACLAVCHVAVVEEHGTLGCEAVGERASLAHEAVLQLGAVENACTTEQDAVLADAARPHNHGRLVLAAQGALVQTCGAFDATVAAYHAVAYFLRVADDCSPSYHTAGMAPGYLAVDDGMELTGELAVALIFNHQRGNLAGESAVDEHVFGTHLAEHRYQGALAIGCAFGGLDDAHVGDEAVRLHHVVVDIA